ncbi:hypothetical protein BD770DRAFT_388271 [Pilaira anomala]|nr:hypothetical protein BD770DRAFT_388271 [Pilaira anomala]
MGSRKYSKEYMESLQHKSEPPPSTMAEKIDTYNRVLTSYVFLERALLEPFDQDQPVYPTFSERDSSSTKKRIPKKELSIRNGRIIEKALGQLDTVKKVKSQLENVRRELGLEDEVGPYLWKLTQCIAETERVINNILSALKNQGYVEASYINNKQN